MVDVEEATPEQGWAILHRAAQEALGISAEDFLRRWDSGEYDGTDDHRVEGVAILIPFAR